MDLKGTNCSEENGSYREKGKQGEVAPTLVDDGKQLPEDGCISSPCGDGEKIGDTKISFNEDNGSEHHTAVDKHPVEGGLPVKENPTADAKILLGNLPPTDDNAEESVQDTRDERVLGVQAVTAKATEDIAGSPIQNDDSGEEREAETSLALHDEEQFPEDGYIPCDLKDKAGNTKIFGKADIGSEHRKVDDKQPTGGGLQIKERAPVGAKILGEPPLKDGNAEWSAQDTQDEMALSGQVADLVTPKATEDIAGPPIQDDSSEEEGEMSSVESLISSDDWEQQPEKDIGCRSSSESIVFEDEEEEKMSLIQGLSSLDRPHGEIDECTVSVAQFKKLEQEYLIIKHENEILKGENGTLNGENDILKGKLKAKSSQLKKMLDLRSQFKIKFAGMENVRQKLVSKITSLNKVVKQQGEEIMILRKAFSECQDEDDEPLII